MQKAYIMALYELVKKDSNIISLLSDSGTEYDELLKREFPDQCINLGIAEENLVGVASGMAIGGLVPFVYTSGAFLAYRAFEFIRDDICFQNLNVKIVGMGSGLAWSTLGPSHLTGCEIAYELALQGKKPVIVEMKNDLIAQKGVCLANSSYLREWFALHQVPVYLETSLKKVEEKAIVCEKKDGKQIEIPCDSVISSAGYIPDPLAQENKQVYLVGDCKKVGNLRSVIWGAYETAMKI